jgi:hypothetical protein
VKERNEGKRKILSQKINKKMNKMANKLRFRLINKSQNKKDKSFLKIKLIIHKNRSIIQSIILNLLSTFEDSFALTLIANFLLIQVTIFKFRILLWIM